MSDEQKPRHIGIAVPCMDQVDAWFAHDLVNAAAHHAFRFPQDDITTCWHQSAFLAEARNVLAKELLEQGVDYVLYLDSDMRFPRTLFHDLMRHELPVVAANCAKRRRPISATARKENPEDPSKLDAVWPDPEKKEGIERVHVVGAAVMCVQADVFFQIDYPWFDSPWLRDEQRPVGEDLFFCAQLKRASIPLHIDHGVSWGVGHVGQYVFRMNDVLAEREMARAGLWDHLRTPHQETANGNEPIVLVK